MERKFKIDDILNTSYIYFYPFQLLINHMNWHL